MNPPEPAPDDTETGLPLLRSWRAVYLCVLAMFCLYIVGMALLPVIFP